MKAFEYSAPSTLEDALKLLSGPDAVALSGGTDLVNRMKDYVTSPARVVYLKDVKPLAGISGDARSGLTLGAGTRLSDIVASAAIRESYPALWQATAEVGSPQIRNMATLGGNLLQRPRCWYYRAGHGLLAMKDGKSLVREGDNRFHAIFMTEGNALFVAPSSLASALAALGSRVTIAGPQGERTILIEDLYQVPRSESDSELALRPGEIVTKVNLPAAAGKSASYEARHKEAQDWPIVLAAVNLTLNGETVSSARIYLAGVAPIPWKCTAAEKAIAGKQLTLQIADEVGEAATSGAAPLSMNAYKVPLVKTTVKRALLAAIGNRYWEA